MVKNYRYFISYLSIDKKDITGGNIVIDKKEPIKTPAEIRYLEVWLQENYGMKKVSILGFQVLEVEENEDGEK